MNHRYPEDPMLHRLLPALVLCSAACSGIADDDYRGELIASLTGTVATTRTAPTPPSQVLVWWGNVAELPDFDGGIDSAAVEGRFPAAFRLDVTTPPPVDLSSASLALGAVSVWPQAGHLTDVDDPILGVEEQHVLLWVEDDAGAAEAKARWNMTVTPGLHVVDVLGLTLAQDEDYYACIRDAGDLPQPCYDEKRATLEANYPEVDWAAVGELGYGDLFELAPDDLDTELSLELRDSSDEINFPQLP